MPQHALVVDDDIATCQLIETILHSADIEALISTHSAQAVKILEGQQFDAVFLDVNMPAPNGIEVTRLIRASGCNQKTTIIMITGDENPALLGRGFDAGANFFLFKPINRERLLNVCRATHSVIQREKRHYQRVVVNCRVQVVVDGEVVEGESMDLSLNGMLVRADRAFAVGTHVNLRLFLPPHPQPATAGGKIIRLDGLRMGIHFDKIAEDENRRLQDFLLPLLLGLNHPPAGSNGHT